MDPAFLAYADALKIYYVGQKIIDLTNKSNPLLAMCARKTIKGQSMPLPVIGAYGQGVSPSYAASKANATNITPYKFNLVTDDLYQVIEIDRKTWKASQGDNAAFLDFMKGQIDGGLQQVGNALGAYVYGNGSGVVAQISTIGSIATGVILLVDPSTVTFFEVGQVLQSTTTNDSNSATNTVGGATSPVQGFVIAVDYNAATITVSGTVSGSAGTPSGWAATQFLGLDGGTGASGFNLASPGIAGWIPFTAPATNDSFLGVNRSVNPARLAGSRTDQSNTSNLEEAWLNGSGLLAIMGETPDFSVCSVPTKIALMKTLQGRLVFDVEIGGAKFEAINVPGINGPMKLMADRNCPQGFSWMGDSSHLGLYSISGAPEIQEDGFGKLLRLADADAYQVVVSAYYCFGIDKPVAFCVMKMPTV
jgi:hypothetical protein